MGSDRGKLFVGGISWETTEEKLRDHFGRYGDVAEAVIMRDRATGRGRGFGFVAFRDPSVAHLVLQDKHTIDGRTVEAKRAVPRDEQLLNLRSVNDSPASLSRTKKIFVGGLPSSLTEADFKKYFEEFGAIANVVVMYDHSTQRPRGFGFITFESEDAVDYVLQKAFHDLNGKMVEVKRAIPKELSPSPARSNGTAIGTISARGAGYGSGYLQYSKPSPVIGFGARVVGRYPPGIQDDSCHVPLCYAGSAVSNGLYGDNVWGSNNDNYGECNDAYGGGVRTRTYAGSPGVFNGDSVGSGNYANTSLSGRNLWASGESSYSSNNSIWYRNHANSSISSCDTLGIWGSPHSLGNAAAYGNSYHGSNYSGYGSSPTGYARQRINYSSSVECYGIGSGNIPGRNKYMCHSSALTYRNWESGAGEGYARASFVMDDNRSIDNAYTVYGRENTSRRHQF